MSKKIGFHLSISGGMYTAIDRAAQLGVDALQVFLKNSNRWSSPPYTEKEVRLFADRWSEQSGLSISAHTGYLINPAGDGENLEKSMALLADEIHRADQLGINRLVLHPGNHKDKGVEAGIKQIAANLDKIFSEDSSDVMILLETTAGQGSSVGHRFEHIRDIIALSRFQHRLGVCLDTCHIFAAGYNFSTVDEYEDTIDQFSKIIGLEKLKIFHFNDSKKGIGTKVDRHEHIGLGEIGAEALSFFLNDVRFDGVDYILETPDDDTRSDRESLEIVRGLFN